MPLEGAGQIAGILNRRPFGIVAFEFKMKTEAGPNQADHDHAEQGRALPDEPQPSGSDVDHRIEGPHAITPEMKFFECGSAK